MSDEKDFIRRAIQNAKGDDLERAEDAFRGMSDDELDRQYGQSGQTRREILDGYREYRKEWAAAMAWLEKID